MIPFQLNVIYVKMKLLFAWGTYQSKTPPARVWASFGEQEVQSGWWWEVVFDRSGSAKLPDRSSGESGRFLRQKDYRCASCSSWAQPVGPNPQNHRGRLQVCRLVRVSADSSQFINLFTNSIQRGNLLCYIDSLHMFRYFTCLFWWLYLTANSHISRPVLFLFLSLWLVQFLSSGYFFLPLNFLLKH